MVSKWETECEATWALVLQWERPDGSNRRAFAYVPVFFLKCEEEE